MFATNGRFYTLEAAKLPGGRGHGEPVRLFIDLEQDADIVAVFTHQGGRKFLVASAHGQGLRGGRGRVPRQYPQGQAGAQREGAGRGARRSAVVEGELVASDRREPQDGDLPARAGAGDGARRGVRLQRYKDGGLSDVTTFKAEDGLTWIDAAGRAFTLTLKELADWRGNRADAGRLAPEGLPEEQQVRRAWLPAQTARPINNVGEASRVLRERLKAPSSRSSGSALNPRCMNKARAWQSSAGLQLQIIRN